MEADRGSHDEGLGRDERVQLQAVEGAVLQDLPDGDMLRFYGERLPAVEIDNSFYRMPKKTVLEGWTHQVPEVPVHAHALRRITHFARLKNTDEPMSFLMSNVRELGPRLGAVLFQLPPNLKKDVDRLRAFLPLIPEDIPAAFEFRHESWFDEEVYTVLREHERALCQADTDEEALDHFVSRLRRGDISVSVERDYTPGDLRTWASGSGSRHGRMRSSSSSTKTEAPDRAGPGSCAT
ncbi:MAG: DUF72 domain-containing protein [Candidatus Eisenbacteria bacterium]